MHRPAHTIAEKMIKVDHAGENGAVNIYRAQKTVSYLRARNLVPGLAQNQGDETKHRRIFGDYLARNGIRRCLSYHACGIGGYALGLVTGLIGPRAVAATTCAVEHVVLRHLEEQLLHLIEADDDAHHCVARIVDEEKSHHDAAASQLHEDTILTQILISVVAFSTEMVIRFGMR
jgi:3-demethoxyubiquinol 3-hydroxylase